jgi:hypothetical protein
MACLVQQLFRQKIGQELDSNLVDDVLFPLLRSRKELARDLLLDIRLTQVCNDEGQSGIISNFHLRRNQECPRNIPPFTSGAVLRSCENRRRGTSGRTTSHFRRKMMGMRCWGSIEILNELRELNHPRVGYQVSPDQRTNSLENWPIGPNISEELDNMYIRLEEFRHWTDPRRSGTGETFLGTQTGGGPLADMMAGGDGANIRDWMQKKRNTDLGLVNDFLENSLHDDNGLSWGGDPESSFKPILSIHY